MYFVAQQISDFFLHLQCVGAQVFNTVSAKYFVANKSLHQKPRFSLRLLSFISFPFFTPKILRYEQI